MWTLSAFQNTFKIWKLFKKNIKMTKIFKFILRSQVFGIFKHLRRILSIWLWPFEIDETKSGDLILILSYFVRKHYYKAKLNTEKIGKMKLFFQTKIHIFAIILWPHRPRKDIPSNKKFSLWLINEIVVYHSFNLINIFIGSPSWNRQHHSQTIHSKEMLISMNLFKTLLGMIIFDLYGYGGCYNLKTYTLVF